MVGAFLKGRPAKNYLFCWSVQYSTELSLLVQRVRSLSLVHLIYPEVFWNGCLHAFHRFILLFRLRFPLVISTETAIWLFNLCKTRQYNYKSFYFNWGNINLRKLGVFKNPWTMVLRFSLRISLILKKQLLGDRCDKYNRASGDWRNKKNTVKTLPGLHMFVCSVWRVTY